MSKNKHRRYGGGQQTADNKQREVQSLTCKVEIAPSDTQFWTDTITPSKIKHAKQQASEGKLQDIQNLYDVLYKENDIIAGDTDVRTEAAKTAVWSLPDGLSKQQEEYFSRFLRRYLPDLIDQTMDLRLCGMVFRQILYEQVNGLYEVAGFEDAPGSDLRVENGELVYYVEDEPQSLPMLQFIALWGNYPVYESLLRYFTFTSFALTHWASFMETYGKPIRIGKYRMGTPQTEKDALWRMVQSLGTDAAAMISENAVIEFVEHKNITASSNLYLDLLTFCENNVTKRILGQTLTTTSQDTGSYAQAKVHNLVREDILQGDLREAGLYVSKICSLLNHINFGTEDIEITLSKPEKVDLASAIVIDKELSTLIELPVEYLYKKYGIPEPEGGYRKAEPSQMGGWMLSNPEPTQLLPLVTQEGYHTVEGVVHSDHPFNYGADGINGVPAFYDAMPISHYLRTPIPEIDEMIKAITDKHDEYVKTLTSYDAIENAIFPIDLYMEYGKQLFNAVLIAFTPKKTADNGKMSSTDKNIITSYNIKEDDIKTEFDWTTEDIDILNHFRADVYTNTFISCVDKRKKLQNEAKKAASEGLTFDQFRQNVKLEGIAPDNPYYLRTEFVSDVNWAYSSRQWHDQQALKDYMPFLKYCTIKDDRVRQDHADMDGIVLNIDHSFWDVNYPPNGYNCRCYTMQLTKEEAKLEPKYGHNAPRNTTTSLNFRGNPGNDKGLPYFYEAQKAYDLIQTYVPEICKMVEDRGDWESYPTKTLKNIKPSSKTPETIIKDLKKQLDEMGIKYDPTSLPIDCSKVLIEHMSPKKESDLQKRAPYFLLLPDVIENPTEMWLQKHKKDEWVEYRIAYIKKYDVTSDDKVKAVMVIIDVRKDGLLAFSMYPADEVHLKNNRHGFPLHKVNADATK